MTDQRKRSTLSAVIITKNEAEVIEKCLAALDWVDEVIVYDSGSTDGTGEIAAKHANVKFVQDGLAWDGFGIQRQRAQSHTVGDYVFMVDADEIVTPELRAAVDAVLENPPSEDTVWRIVRRDLFFGKVLHCARNNPIRLYPRKYGYQPQQIHESVDPQNARVSTLKGVMIHDTCRSFADFQTKRLRFALDWGQERHEKGKRIRFFSIFPRAAFTFWSTFLLKGGIRDGWYGALYSALMAQYTFNKYAFLWVMNRKNGKKEKNPSK